MRRAGQLGVSALDYRTVASYNCQPFRSSKVQETDSFEAILIASRRLDGSPVPSLRPARP